MENRDYKRSASYILAAAEALDKIKNVLAVVSEAPNLDFDVGTTISYMVDQMEDQIGIVRDLATSIYTKAEAKKEADHD